MRRLIKFLMLGTLAFMCSGSVKVGAATTKVDGITWVYTVANNKATNVYATQGASGDLVIPEKINGYEVVSIGGGTDTTQVATNITSVSIPSNVYKINDYAFYQSNLKSISLGAGNNVAQVGNKSFAASSLESVVIGEKVKEIGDSSFHGCPISRLNMRDFTGEVGNNAFEENTVLEEVYVGQVENLGEYAFKGCIALKNIEIDSNKLTTQFQDCYSIENIVIDENVKVIEPGAFAIRNCGVAKADIKELTQESTIRTDAYYLSDALVENKTFETMLQPGAERNWYFKNPDIQLGESVIGKDETYYQSWKQDEKDYGTVDMITYDTESIFFPCLKAETFRWECNGRYETFLAYKTSYNGIKYESKIPFLGEYNNTPSGYAINNVFVNCGANTGDGPEFVQESACGTIYESISKKALNVYTYKDSTEIEIPNYIPEPVVSGIEVTYSDEVTEGVPLDTSKLEIKAFYDNDTSEIMVYDSNIMSIDDQDIVVGENVFHFTMGEDISCDFTVIGVKKQLIKVEASYPDEVTEGVSLDTSKLEIKAFYDNDTSEIMVYDSNIMSIDDQDIVVGENVFHFTMGEDISCDFTVIGVKKQLIKVEASYPDEVTEGVSLDTSKLVITAFYNNETVEKISFNRTAMSLSTRNILEGKNTIQLNVEGIICDFEVIGTKKKASSLDELEMENKPEDKKDSNSIQSNAQYGTPSLSDNDTKANDATLKENILNINKRLFDTIDKEINKVIPSPNRKDPCKSNSPVLNKKTFVRVIGKEIKDKKSHEEKSSKTVNRTKKGTGQESVGSGNVQHNSTSNMAKDSVGKVTVYSYPDGQPGKVTSWELEKKDKVDKKHHKEVKKASDSETASFDAVDSYARSLPKESEDIIETTFEGAEIGDKLMNSKGNTAGEKDEQKLGKGILIVVGAVAAVVIICVIVFNRKKDGESIDEDEFVDEDNDEK